MRGGLKFVELNWGLMYGYSRFFEYEVLKKFKGWRWRLSDAFSSAKKRPVFG